MMQCDWMERNGTKLNCISSNKMDGDNVLDHWYTFECARISHYFPAYRKINFHSISQFLSLSFQHNLLIYWANKPMMRACVQVRCDQPWNNALHTEIVYSYLNFLFDFIYLNSQRNSNCCSPTMSVRIWVRVLALSNEIANATTMNNIGKNTWNRNL